MYLPAIALLAAINLCAISVNLLTATRIMARHFEKTELVWRDALALLRAAAPGNGVPES